MKVINLFAIIVSVISTTVLPIAILFYLSRKKQLKTKFLLFGIFLYFISRLLFSLLYMLVTQGRLTSLPIGVVTLTQVMSMTFLCIAIKKIFYDKVYRVSGNVSMLLSLGCGEGLVETLLLLFPSAFNNLMYYIEINDGSIYKYFSKSYSFAEIRKFVALFSARSTAYFLYIAVSGLLIILLQMIIAYYIGTQKKGIIPAIFAALILYMIYYVSPFVSYWLAVALSLIAIAWAGMFIRNNVDEG